MTFYPWTEMNLFSRTGMEAWHQFEPGVSGNELIFDVSGNGRHILCPVGNSPVLIGNVLNNQPAWFFNGSRDPLKFTGDLTVRHLFVVAAVQNSTFTDYNGLLTDVSSKPLLIGNGNGTNTFFDLTALPTNNYSYRKADVPFVPNNQIAPISGRFAILEMIFPDGIALNGIQIGQDRANASRKLLGSFAENLMFSVVKPDAERLKIYRYFAMRYHLWRTKSDNLDIFPFPFNRSTPFVKTDLVELSEAEGNRGRDRVVRYLSDEALGSYDFRFEFRRTVEMQSADRFLAQHRLHIPFWVEDKERDQERKIVRTSLDVSNQPTSVNLQNYGFAGNDY